MKIIKTILIFGLMLSFSSCASEDNKRGGLYQNELCFSTYEEANNCWNEMNKYKDEGFCVSFPFEIEEYKNIEKYYLRGIDCTYRYFEDSKTSEQRVFFRKGLFVHYSSYFAICYVLKNWTYVEDGATFEWQDLPINVDPTPATDEHGSFYYWADYRIPTNCDTKVCLINKNSNIGLIIGYSSIINEDIFMKYKDLIKTKFEEALNDRYN